MKNASIRVNVEKQIPNVGLRLFSVEPYEVEPSPLKTLGVCDDPPEDRVISMFTGCLSDTTP
jgi:hypothetical protein